MFTSIYLFEIRQQLKRPFIWIVCLLMYLQGIYYMHHSGEFYANDETYANAPAIFFTVFAGIGYVGFIVTAIIAGTVITKDLQSRFSSILFTTSVSESGYFWGRYWAGFTLLLILNFFYLLGAFSYSFLPVKNIGPVDYYSLLMAVVYILLPNTFILFTSCFCAASLSRDVKSSYLMSMFIMLIMIFSVSMHEFDRSVAFYDPTSFGVLIDDLEHMSPAEKNAYLPSATGNLLWNRLGWILLCLVLLIYSRIRFSFKNFSKGTSGKKEKKKDATIANLSLKISNKNQLEPVNKKFSLSSYWKNVFSLSLTECKSVIAPTGFKIFLGILLVMYVCYIAVWQQQYYSEAPTLPVTVEVTNITIALSFYFQLFIIINTVELLFRNQTSGFWKIADALPIPSWVTTVSKINAMIMVSLLLSICLIVFGIGVQIFKGYYHFELDVYFKEIILRWLPKYIEYILLCVAVAGITGNKYATHGLSILVLVVTIILHEIGVLEQHRFAFSFSPGALKYTDMNGSSFYAFANLIYSLYWISFTLILTFTGLWVWPRGLVSPLAKRLNFRGNLSKLFLFLLVISAGIFMYSSYYIYETVNVENKFSSREQERNEDAEYEKKYKKYQKTPQPQIKHIDISLNLFPENRKINYQATIELLNPHSVAVDTLHVDWDDFLVIRKINLPDNELTLISQDEENRHSVYKIKYPIQPQRLQKIQIEAQKIYSGFTNDDPQKDLTFNGSFISENMLPFFGYDDRRELAENKYREDLGLEKMKSSLPEVNNSYGNSLLFASTQAQQFTYNCTISTSENQNIVMPGILLKKWSKNQRTYYNYTTEIPVTLPLNILSAHYAFKRADVNINGKTIRIEVAYHPYHSYAIDSWIQSAKEALTFLSKNLGEYPYSNLVIAERPRYDEDLATSGNLIILPENHGWIADIKRNEDLDYLRYITTRLIAEQYLKRGNFSRVQGYPFLTQSIPGYLALVQLESYYGKNSTEKFLKKNHDKYSQGRAVAGIPELPVLFCDENQEYLFNHKGIETLYSTGAKIGTQNVLNQIHSFYKQSLISKKKLTAIDWYNGLVSQEKSTHNDYLKNLYFSLN
ncbi:ABC transporter permease [Apibacter sp. HY039]|uniref:ABC transporter permease n=1 Tax=Apibacter sp. HY039 TaxID=2501476 RepID=UPI000FEBED52|nr:hypothetical protein [Apibacter sp. HY039]